MGNFRGTVTCGACYQQGHNKRSCPRLTERLQKNYKHLADAIASGDASSWDETRAERMAKQIAKRTGTNPQTGEKLVKRGPKRRCSYCKYQQPYDEDHGVGHTRRTCAAMKEDRRQAVAATAILRKAVLEHMQETGIGVGALMLQRLSGYFPDPNNPNETTWDRREVATMVKSIHWDAITVFNPQASIFVTQRVNEFGTTNAQYVELPYIYDDMGERMRISHDGTISATAGNIIGTWYVGPHENESAYNRKRLLSGVSGATIKPPANWLSGDSPAIDAVLKDRKG